MAFPSEIVEEGKTSVEVPKLKFYINKPGDYAPSKAPVFYNSEMELNRDFAVLALQIYQEMAGKEISGCEPFTGCGIRGIRFAVEVDGVRKVIVNDINPKATKLAIFNTKRNKVVDHVVVMNEDANLLMSRFATPRERFDFVDVDPFGSPVPYLDTALRALRDRGFLALTATDMAPLCGVYPKVCLRKYGGKSLRTEYCHELGVRLLVGCLIMIAARHKMGVEVLFSQSIDHYIRAYAVVRHGARYADNSVQKMGWISHCFSCFHREMVEGIISNLKRECSECRSKLEVAGPLWLGKIFDRDFCSLMLIGSRKKELGQKKRINRILSLVHEESEAPMTYYVTDKICDKLNLPTPPLVKVMKEIRRVGFQTTRTHFDNRGFRTSAPASVVREVVESFVS